MANIYRWQAQIRIGGGPPVNGHLHIDFDAAMMAALAYGTWVAWSTELVDDEMQPVLQECDGDGPTVGDWGWTEIPTDDPRVLAFFDCPDVDEIERQIVQRLTGYQYGLREDVAREALGQVEQYDGYRVQSIVHVVTDEERSNGPRVIHSTGLTDRAVAS